MNKLELHCLVQETQPNICQIVALKNGEEVYADEWNGYSKNDTCHVMSVTKSVVAILIGIAIDQGLIKSIDQKVLDIFPDYQVKRGEKTIYDVTIKHLLTMRAPYKYQYEPWTKVCTSNDWTIAALDLLGEKKGITNEFKYSTLGIHILTGILTKVSGMKVVDYANQYLFLPLGMKIKQNYHAKTVEEHKHFTINKEPKANVWFCDPQGVGTAGYGLCFSASDMAKLGQLCLNKGMYQGMHIVSSSWVDLITTPTYQAGEEFRKMQYGYLWWIMDDKKKIYAAIGNSGNVIYVNEEAKIVITITAYFKPTILDRVDFIQKYIEPLL